MMKYDSEKILGEKFMFEHILISLPVVLLVNHLIHILLQKAQLNSVKTDSLRCHYHMKKQVVTRDRSLMSIK